MSVAIQSRNIVLLTFMRYVARFALCPFFKLQVSGLEYLPKQDAFILLPKHQRWEDIPLIALAVSRPLYYMAKYELFQNSISGWFLSSLGGIPLNREQPLKSRGSLRKMFRSLKKGQGVVVFPEGTYYKKGMGPGRAGLIRLIASKSTIPFIPMGIHYAGNKGRKYVRIRIGVPIYRDPGVKVNTFLSVIMKKIAQLSGL
jgi:1-acyl-sn-glycerol-3-phosphate acyltransferase